MAQSTYCHPDSSAWDRLGTYEPIHVLNLGAMSYCCAPPTLLGVTAILKSGLMRKHTNPCDQRL